MTAQRAHHSMESLLPMSSNPHRFKLFLMMVLEFFIWGAWLPLIFSYLPSLKFSSSDPPAALSFLAAIKPFGVPIFSEQSMILNAFPVAAIVGLFFSNQFADRNFAAEKFLAFSHLIGGLALLALGFTTSFWPFLLFMYIYCLLFVPTISITNAIAFANLKDSKEFGIVRMGGTIGWVLAAWPFTFIFVDWKTVNATPTSGPINWLGTVLSNGLTGDALREATKYTFIVAGIAALILAAFSLTLPHTPPKKAEAGQARESLAWAEAFKLLRHPFVLVLFLVTFVDAFVHNSYFNWTGGYLSSSTVGIKGNWVMPVMSIGQIAEISTMAILAFVLKRLGWRATMILGILGHAARFGVYAFVPNATAIVIVQILHGICYAFFFATVYIFVDEYFPKDARASAQGLFNVMILGIGALAANILCPWLLGSVFTGADKVVDYRHLFQIPMFCAIIAAIALLLFFHPPKKAVEEPELAEATA